MKKKGCDGTDHEEFCKKIRWPGFDRVWAIHWCVCPNCFIHQSLTQGDYQ